ncbi:MAG: sodium:solute symporter [Prevotella sp.]|nr:sodium:solute symporter [Prevotella sp.]
MLILLTIIIYFSALLVISRLTARRSDNETFYRAGRRSPWYMVAFGMVGASISGITFVSVPGMVLKTDMTYLQMCVGFILGYFIIGLVLLPVYYKLNLTTIYTYLKERLGQRSYKTGAWFFLISKMTGAAVRFYVVCIILQKFVLSAYGIPFPVTVLAMVLLIWLYTRRSGIKTLVWTDTFQTFCMFAALILIIFNVIDRLGMTTSEAVSAIVNDVHSSVFVFDDWISRQNFWKQFFSGAFVAVVMTGFDQDMMQKNLTCKTLRDAQKDVCTYGLAFVPANLLFLSLGVLLTILASRMGIALPEQGDDLLPMFAASGRLGDSVVVLFTIGVVAAAFSSADSALTALTTSFCVDIVGRQDDERLRRRAHIGVAVVFIGFVLAFKALNNTSVIDAIYILCSYTYGPLLGLFSYGLITHRPTCDRLVPYVCVASPLLCLLIDNAVASTTGYKFGYEMLMLNGLLTFLGLYIIGSWSKEYHEGLSGCN